MKTIYLLAAGLLLLSGCATSGTTHSSNAPVSTTLTATCTDQTQPVALSASRISITGTVTGDAYCEFLLNVQARQTVQASLNSAHTGMTALVYDTVSHDFASGDYTATQAGQLPVRVLLTRNAARTANDPVPFTLTLTVR